jgi:hypothetical protein
MPVVWKVRARMAGMMESYYASKDGNNGRSAILLIIGNLFSNPM